MIFPSEELYELHRSLVRRTGSGEISEREGFEEALRADPDDPIALNWLAVETERDGDLEKAEHYARAGVRMHPNGHLAYFTLSRVLPSSDAAPDRSLATGYAVLGLSNLLFDVEALEHFDGEAYRERLGLGEKLEDLDDASFLLAIIEGMKKLQSHEPASVEQELRPHRLVHELREHRDDLLDRSVVESILENGAACQPLLIGILKEFGAKLLDADDDYRVVEWALALLGEIGDPAVFPALLEFLAQEDQDNDLSGPAEWAFQRICRQHTSEALEKMREMAASDFAVRILLATQIAQMPNVPGKIALLTSFTSDLQGVPKMLQDGVVMSVITAFYLIEGGGSFRAAALERKYAGGFPGEMRKHLRAFHREVDGMDPIEPSTDETSIFDICCTDPPESDDEDDEEYEDEDEEYNVPEPVVKVQKPGRNEPCWCGSGKKYKKCHLAQDEKG
ncbi:MAG TPA: SEC-C metal-binding domain-containing protein [Bryobacteraceae bacterium]|nr:SEC-C metal-binding domain-containing protein [Bryobacteraceae bacterium]